MGDMDTGSTLVIDEERRGLVRDSIERWVARLIDLSRRNNLIYFRPTKSTLELTDCDDEELDRLLHGRKVALSALVTEEEQVEASGKLQEIRRKALANFEEKGLETLFLGVGMATWEVADEGRPPEAAVLLLPMDIQGKGRETRTLSLERSGEAQINPVLLHVLNNELGVDINEEQLLTLDEASEEERLNPATVFSKLLGTAEKVLGFGISRKVVLGNFSFQKMAMVKDLRENEDALVSHDLIASIAGHLGAREAVLGDRCEVGTDELDQTPANEEFLVLDADSSQQRVIRCVQSTQDGVIHGPPGTGKSQTISNLIAALAVQGKKVLFVAEKRAALEVVLKRLQRLGLGHLALDLHGASTTRKEVMGRIAESLEIIRDSSPTSVEEAHRRFEDRRTKLNEHTVRMHRPWPPAGISVYEMQGRLLRLSDEARNTIRWRGANLERLDRAAMDEIKDVLNELGASYRSLFLRDDPSPWNGASLSTGSEAQHALRTSRELLHEDWPQLQHLMSATTRAAEVLPSLTIENAEQAALLFGRANQTLQVYKPNIFGRVARAVVEALEPADRGALARLNAFLFSGTYRAARKLMVGSRRDKAPATVLLQEARNALAISEKWTALSGPGVQPRQIEEADSLLQTIEIVKRKLLYLESVLGRQVTTIPLPHLQELIRDLASDDHTVLRLPRLSELEQSLQDRELGALVEHLRVMKPPSEVWGEVAEHAWLSSMLDLAREQDSSIAGFDGRIQDALVEEFKELDRLRLELAVARVKRQHAETAVAARNRYPDQDQLISREAGKRSRHQPLRATFERAPSVLTALRPCWMASPLTVSQLLGPQQAFDIVIFDEASQVLPHDAIPSLMRAHKTVVAGDRNQLPPTTFFFYGGDEDESAETAVASEGFESLLDLLSAFLEPWSLDWHYRSKSEELIAFSNRHIYGDRLVTFPSAGELPAVTHELVQWAPKDGQEESSSAEVERVVELVLEHATAMLQRSEDERETLGVIAMGIKHSRRIEGALDEALRNRPDLDEFFDLNADERFFVKNLERVQGDERDNIMLSVGYGKDRSGRLPYRFGPLLMEGGERRLNVAITRARRKMTLVSSFTHQDMDPGRSSRRGVELLRLYLQYAASNGRLLGDTSDTGVALNEFEQAVKDALEERGMRILPQWGASKYRIDLVAAHPTRPGRLVLAIECDGATYHSAPTARDRDRLRQQHLEALGWRFHRIWSTDWFMRREEEIQRALQAFERAVTFADKADNGEVRYPPSEKVPNAVPLSENDNPERTKKPFVSRGLSITDYSDPQLKRLLGWIQSDGKLRTDEELVQEMVTELGYRRRGARIDERLRSIVRKYRK